MGLLTASELATCLATELMMGEAELAGLLTQVSQGVCVYTLLENTLRV